MPRAPARKPPPRTRDIRPDLPAAASAVRDLLRALRVPVESDPELTGTPDRVARMWAEELLDGYAADPADALRDGVSTRERGLVVLTGLRFTFVCPHHMTLSSGRAHVGYLPGGRVVGLGSVVRLIETFAHRMVLQESLGQRVADALVEHLGARGAGVVIRARHQCLSARGEKQAGAAVATASFAGLLADEPAEREAFLRMLPRRR